jgi:hypothetical protein
VSPLESSFCLGEEISLNSGNNIKDVRRVCGGSAAILNTKAGGI